VDLVSWRHRMVFYFNVEKTTSLIMTHIKKSVLILLIVSCHCFASGEVSEFWNELSFRTEGGDFVSISLENCRLKSMRVELRGKIIKIPDNALLGLDQPVLQKVNLVRSFSMEDGESKSSIILKVPTINEDLDRSLVVWFVFSDEKLLERNVWTYEPIQKLISVESY